MDNPPRPAPPQVAGDWALFLDVDGCLLDFALAPDAVVVPDALLAQLATLARRLHGAVALVSGRSLASLDALFAPLHLPAAGLHGLERRSDLRTLRAPAAPPALRGIQERARQVVAEFPGALVEDKGVALGLHWRGAPAAAPALQALAEDALPQLDGYRLQHGDHVVELRPAVGDKGAAIADLLEEPPFHGRLPVFVGDDLTDESGFALVNALGGISVLVGAREPSEARHALADPRAVRAWLATAVAHAARVAS